MARERQTTPIATARLNSAELGLAFEDAGGLSGFGAQKQATVRFGSSSMLEGSKMLQSLAALGILGSQWRDMYQFSLAMVLAASSDSGATAESPSQSLVAAVDALVSVNEEQFLTSLTEDDHQRLVASLDKLLDLVGENENHFLVPLMDFIDNLIEKNEEKPNMTDLRLLGRGLRTASNTDEPEYTPAQLDLINSQYQDSAQDAVALQRDGATSPGRMLRTASNADEPEYTPAQLDLINSQYQEPAEK